MSTLKLTRYQNGLILVTGSVGSGKSTSLASLVNFINQDREDHILTRNGRGQSGKGDKCAQGAAARRT